MAETIFHIVGANLTPPALSDSVIVLIDAQNEYVSGRLALEGMTEAVGAAAELLRRARAAGAPVIHIQQLSAPERPLFTPGSPLADFIPDLAPQPGEIVIGKRNSSAFGGTNLAEVLRATGRKELILAGFMTHNCVTATARSAEDHGLRTTIVAAATASRDLPDSLTGVIVPAKVNQAAALAALADRTSVVIADASCLT
ncbi:cysteine hydrolase family protein [Asticcacaulis benevestitus]|uniref:Isochorismatase-like domain-containing protein n=1 Tax=Asticcacaulis benevestitus DSM 16100 = ATCC BAA-896 TaxID=1121022 RepID=V4PUD5_9CAUL|nr:cysteine hydrolase family protein [Asticcacaulis benevestitus]ESQ90994.1 hypothetical protein ABENE_11120 [Asticcacaulis benevestitus DSM 16100 = ATCC BAA-896]